jgi:mono/diheme cytochrome c family protein
VLRAMPPLTRRRVSAAAAALAAVVACAGASPEARADARRGETLYRTHCATCHGTTATSTSVLAIVAAGGSPAPIEAQLRTNTQMQFLRALLEPEDLADIAEFVYQRFGPPVALATAVEFYHAAFDHYFVSAAPAEIAALDAGTTIRGWTRTGGTFRVWPGTAGAPAGASPVCRFYIPPAFGDSHFYSASPSECAEVRTRFPQFAYEAPEVMAVRLPDLATGACPAGTTAVYRLWNARADTNHRYTTDRTVRQAMIDRGHVPEGYGPEGVAFCAPT